MDSTKLNDWMQVVGIFALVASLIFVGMQMRLDHEIARVMIYQDRASSVAETSMAAAASPEALAATIKSAFGDPDQEILMDGWAGPISAQDMVHGTFQVNAFLALADNSYFQYQEGFLPREHWLSVRSTLRINAARNPFLRYRIEQSLDQQRPAFRDVLIAVIAELDQPDSADNL